MTLEARITRHVNRLFDRAQDTLANRELKEEIHSNLAARIEDYWSREWTKSRLFRLPFSMQLV